MSRKQQERQIFEAVYAQELQRLKMEKAQLKQLKHTYQPESSSEEDDSSDFVPPISSSDDDSSD